MATFAPLPTLAPLVDTTASDAVYENPPYNSSDSQLDNLIAQNPTTYDSILADAYANPVPTTLSDESDMYLSTPAVGSTASPSASSVPTATIPNATTSAASNATGVLTSIWNVITGNIENGIFVILGLLLIAAGIFAFKTSQTIIQVAGKAATKVGETAAVAAA